MALISPFLCSGILLGTQKEGSSVSASGALDSLHPRPPFPPVRTLSPASPCSGQVSYSPHTLYRRGDRETDMTLGEEALASQPCRFRAPMLAGFFSFVCSEECQFREVLECGFAPEARKVMGQRHHRAYLRATRTCPHSCHRDSFNRLYILHPICFMPCS
ncbi:hypothetical protein KC316_g84 [Hortaea werneckii]|nr:hypothetical protein KC316_g84 [Hortaea werneckii]